MRVISVKHSHKLVTYINSLSALWSEMRAHFTAVDLGKKKLSGCIVGCRFPCPKERTPEWAHSICHKRRDKPLKKLNFWTVCVCMYACVQRETATLPSYTPYQATKELLGLSSIMLSFGNGRTSECSAHTHRLTHITICVHTWCQTHKQSSQIENTY